MTKKTIESVRASLVRVKSGVGRPYPEAAQRAAIELLENGGDVPQLAEQLGIRAATLRKWQRRAPPSRFCEVQVVDSEPASSAGSLRVHGPCGLVIEGLTLAELAELMRRLA